MSEQTFTLYPDAAVAPAGYAAFPKSWDAAIIGPIPSYVLIRRADDAGAKRAKSIILKTRGADIPWDSVTAPPPRVAVCESSFAAIAGSGEVGGVAVTISRARLRMRVVRRLQAWLATGWVLPTEIIRGVSEAAD